MGGAEWISDCGKARLILGDCLEVLPGLKEFDAILSDPPYGISYQKGSGGKGKHNRRNHSQPIYGDDIPFDPAPFLNWPCILWGANHFSRRLPEARGRWLAWNKLGNLEAWDSFSDVEFGWQNHSGADRIFSLLWKGICQDEKESSGIRWHPTQKPIALMRWCLSFFPAEFTTILDPFMGSGTTGVACVRTGRKFIGIEKEPKYFEVAKRRISDELNRFPLLEPKLEPAQLSLLPDQP